MNQTQGPTNQLVTPRGSGIATFMGLPHARDLAGVDAAIAGIPADTGGTPGSSFGPRAMRDASALLRPAHAHHRVSPFHHLRAIDYGDLPVVPGSIGRTLEAVEAGLAPLYEAGVVPIGLGGDHSLTLAVLRAASRVHGPVAMIQFDAHTDTYDSFYETERYNAGTMFRRAAEEGVVDTAHSIMVGLRGTVYTPDDYQDARDLGFAVRTMDDVVHRGIPHIIDDIRARAGDRKVHLTFDVDCIDPAFMPGTGSLEIGGFATREVLAIVRALGGLNYVSFDVMEVNPLLDTSRISATCGATLAFEFLCLLALARSGGTSP